MGVIAATDTSYSGYNDLLVHGTYDSFWDGYDIADGGNIYPHSFRPAEAFLYGRYYMFYWEGDSSTTKLEFELFHWHGDPEMMVTTAVPQAPVVSFSEVIPVESTELAVSCDVDGALVAVSDGGTLLGRASASGGMALVSLTPPPPAPTPLDVVVTGHNLVSWEGTCEVIVPEGPWLAHRSHVIDDSVAGNGDGIVNPGESVVVSVSVENIGVEPGAGLSATLTSLSSHCTVGDGVADLPDIDVGVTASTLPDHFSYDIDAATPHAETIPFTVDWSADGGFSGSTSFATKICHLLQISNVSVVEITESSARISWTTNVPATSRVVFGTTAPPAQIVEDSGLTTSHSLLLTGLDGCTRYVFAVSSESPGCYQLSGDNSGAFHAVETLNGVSSLSEDFEGAAPGWSASGTYGDFQLGAPSSVTASSQAAPRPGRW